ncbi:hypothetical protein BS50DRAFT_573223 [Corynespora cassiicola Philippines]|uniref:Developmental regulatory protein wetA n=1 Tax=Corynespora cassiicola Philippines TaxID=1448308 RepID=A0A2T2NSE6_CORCC|nr:hypothetical protein BS50DRAFT_573223 [Corynespora cassiicola Philippines]
MKSLLKPQTEISIRPDMNKEIEVADLDRLFEEYLDTDFLQQPSSDITAEASSDDLAHLFGLPSSNGSAPLETSPLPNWDATEDSWHKALQKVEQNPASSALPNDSFSIYPKSRGKASLSDPEIFSFDDIFELDQVEPRASISQPSTPTPEASRPARKVATPTPDRSLRQRINKTPKRSALSSFAAKMMRPSQYRAGLQDLWSRKVDSPADTFNLQVGSNGIKSPSSSMKLHQEEQSNGFFSRDQPSYTIAMSPLPGDDGTTSNFNHSNYQLTPLSSPAIDIGSSNGAGNKFQFSNENLGAGYIPHLSSTALSALQTPPPTHRLPMNAWGSDTQASLDFSFSASPEFQTPASKNSGWWSSNSASGSASLPVTQPSTPGAFQSSHSRSASHNQSLHFDSSPASIAGLGISCDTSPFEDLEGDLGGSMGTSMSMSSSIHGLPPSASSSFDLNMTPYTSLYAPAHSSHQGIPIGQPQPRTPSHSRSPSLSPQPRFTRRRHSSQISPHGHRATTSRRKSSNPSAQPHQRSASGGSGVGFVNFTPDDSRKILTGVAPSGSSKTKARREKEAAEKRRKLSQAAMKAVIEAGGDIKRLEKEGLLVLEG